MTQCSSCGVEVPPDEPGVERRPCPNCGSLARTHEASGTLAVGVGVSAKAVVERGVNEVRIAAFTVILEIAVGVGIAVGFAASPWLGLLVGVGVAVGTALMLAAIHRIPLIRRVVMELMHRITGQ